MTKSSNCLIDNYSIKTHNLTFATEETILFSNLTLTLAPQQLWLIHGDNGVGKTTLLKLLAQLIMPTSGTVHWHNLVHQDILLLRDYAYLHEAFTIAENLNFLRGLFYCKQSSFDSGLLRTSGARNDKPLDAPPSLRASASEAKQSRKTTGLPRTSGARNDEVIEKSSVISTKSKTLDWEFAGDEVIEEPSDNIFLHNIPLDRKPQHLSTGMRKKVILSLLSSAPQKIWLLDEPFTHIDASTQNHLSQLINKHTAAGGLCLFTSHQPTCIQPTHKIEIHAVGVLSSS